MYVFVTLAELTGGEKHLQLGPVGDGTPLRELLNDSLARANRFIPEQDRNDARHFWHNDGFVPFENRLLRDIATTANVALELRPDHYMVFLPRRPAQRYAIDPELTVGQILDDLLGEKEASCCWEMLPRGGRPLDPARSLWDQRVLPFHARLSQEETELVVRRRSGLWLSALLILVLCLLVGLGVGYVLARLGL